MDTIAMDTTHATNGALSETEHKLAEIKARRTQLAEARELRAQPTPEQQLAIEERRLREEEKLDALESEHGKQGIDWDVVRWDEGMIAVRRPHMAVFRRYQDKGKTDSEAQIALTRPCILYPTKDEWDAMCEQRPFLLVDCANAVCTLAGVRVDQVQKK